MGSSRPRTAQKNENFEEVQELALSQNLPQSHLTIREISQGISESKPSVHEIQPWSSTSKKGKVNELMLANKQAQLEHSRNIVHHYLAHIANPNWLTDEKLFTITTPKNGQNECLYAVMGTQNCHRNLKGKHTS